MNEKKKMNETGTKEGQAWETLQTFDTKLWQQQQMHYSRQKLWTVAHAFVAIVHNAHTNLPHVKNVR